MSEDNTPITEQDVNPLLARVHLPGQTFRLPSGALFYKNGELTPDVIDGEVHVKPMAAYDEILLKTPDLLLSGQAIEQVFNRCIPQIKKPLDLFGRDVDFLMVCLRSVTYGEEMQVLYSHGCENAKEHSYVIDLNQFINDSRPIDPTKTTKSYVKVLDGGQKVNLHPARMKDVLKMMQTYNPTEVMTAEQELDDMLNTILSVISDVDGVENPKYIKEWLSTISAAWARELSLAIEETGNFGPELIHKCECKDCKQPISITAPINPISFFT